MSLEPVKEEDPSARFYLALWLVFAAFAAALYWPALTGPLVADDMVYVAANPWTSELSLQRVLEVLNPMGDARFYQVNYAPLHLLLTALEVKLFGTEVLGYHLVNVLLHAGNATLLAALLTRAGLAPRVALLGGLLFLVHPANVEAVAWMSQLKSVAALGLALGALLSLGRRPLLATLLFGAGLLVKASAAFALPMALAFAWCGARDGTAPPRWRWLGAWAVLLALYAVPQVTALEPRGTVEVPAYEHLSVHLATMASIGLRYLAMAGSSLGLSFASEHPPVESWSDPWALGALPVAVLLGWRMAIALWRRCPESAFWIGAAASFVPISQLFPFLYPMGDRYLYFLLPGLIGGCLFLLRDVRLAIEAGLSRVGHPISSRVLVWLATAAGCLLTLSFAYTASQRAGLWRDPVLLEMDSARNFPEGRTATYLRAVLAAQSGDFDGAVEGLRRAAQLGKNDFRSMQFDSMLDPLREQEAFQALMYELAGLRIQRLERLHYLTALELRELSAAQFQRGEFADAECNLQEAVARGGALQRQFAGELEMLRSVLSATREDALPPR